MYSRGIRKGCFYRPSINVLAKQGKRDVTRNAVIKAAEESARSWGAFGGGKTPMGIDHHLYDRTFVATSVVPICLVHGAVKGCIGILEDTNPKQTFD